MLVPKKLETMERRRKYPTHMLIIYSVKKHLLIQCYDAQIDKESRQHMFTD